MVFRRANVPNIRSMRLPGGSVFWVLVGQCLSADGGEGRSIPVEFLMVKIFIGGFAAVASRGAQDIQCYFDLFQKFVP